MRLGKRARNPVQKESSNRVEALGQLAQVATQDVDTVLKTLNSSPDGLAECEAKARLKKYGLNELAQEKPRPWYISLLLNFKTPFNLLLMTVALVSYLTGSIDATIIISFMVLLSVFLRFVQEHRSSQAAEKLKSLVKTTATVLRIPDTDKPSDKPQAGKSVREEVAMSCLVPGDIVHLSSGDMVPADMRLVTAKDLMIAEAALTGESMPVEKSAQTVQKLPANPIELPNICFMGTNVVSGTALGVVVLTGQTTYFGSIAKTIIEQKGPTSFDRGINALSILLVKFIVVMVSIIFLINGVSKGNWAEAFLFALAVAVGLTPELLPMIVTTNLAKGAIAMSKKKVIVKRLNAIQNFGAMDILCTDKTGTLTQNRIILEQSLDITGKECEKTIEYAYLNSANQTGLKNLLDDAILRHVEEAGGLKIQIECRKIDEIPFDFTRRRMSVILEKDHQTHLLICKGAVEEILQVCTQAEEPGGQLVPVDNTLKAQLLPVTRDLNEDGFRVIAVAYKEEPMDKTHFSVTDESDLILLGYVSFLDPPKETAIAALAALERHGVHVKILTGDNELVTRKICKDVRLPIQNRILLGADIVAMDDKALMEATDKANVFAKLTPQNKDRIVRAISQKGHVVGFLGDGINDASALKAADVGISVDDAVDIAKESADIILLEKSLMLLEEGVLEGRMVFGNIMKYIRMTTSSNFGNVFSVVGASAILPFLPMQPIQILTQNLLYDFSQTGIPLDTVDPEYLTQPRKWEIRNIRRYMICFGPISSIFDYVTFALMWFVYGANSIATQSLFQSGWFVEGLLSQTIIIHMLRTAKIPFIQSWAAWPLTALTTLILSIGIFLPFSPLGHVIGLRHLPHSYFLWLTLILISYCILVQLVKTWFIRKYGYD